MPHVFLESMSEKFVEMPVFFRQRGDRGACYAHCARWLGYTLEGGIGAYWSVLVDEGSLQENITAGDRPAIRITPPRSGDAMAQQLQILYRPENLDLTQQERAEAQAALAWSFIGSVLPDSVKGRIKGRAYEVGPYVESRPPKSILDLGSEHMLCLHELSGTAVHLMNKGIDLRSYTHHEVASLRDRTRFFFFDPNVGQFVVKVEDAEELLDNWWMDCMGQPLNYDIYNQVQTTYSTFGWPE
jgi:hypothetical protein